MTKTAVLWFLSGYQRYLSLDHGLLGRVIPLRVCRFWPSCSQYAIESVQQYGVIKGGAKSIRRIGKCHPWHPGGLDPVV